MESASAAAWYAAIISTIALVWQIIVHLRKGPKLIWSATHNMISSYQENDRKLLFTAYNVGDRPTTITHLMLECRSTFWNRLRRRGDKGYIAGNTGVQPLPHLIKPGERWMGFLTENMDVYEDIKNGILWAVICYDGVKTEKFKIVFKKDSTPPKSEKIDGETI